MYVICLFKNVAIPMHYFAGMDKNRDDKVSSWCFPADITDILEKIKDNKLNFTCIICNYYMLQSINKSFHCWCKIAQTRPQHFSTGDLNSKIANNL